MKYRGFNITSCTDNSIERQDENGNEEICKGYYCQIYSVDDDLYANEIDSFYLAVGHEIEDLSDDSLNKGIKTQIDFLYDNYIENKAGLNAKRIHELLGRAVG